MSVPLFVSERSKPKITTQLLSVGCLIFAPMDQIDFTGPFEVLSLPPLCRIGTAEQAVLATCASLPATRPPPTPSARP